jgi:hypothetical protein
MVALSLTEWKGVRGGWMTGRVSDGEGRKNEREEKEKRKRVDDGKRVREREKERRKEIDRHDTTTGSSSQRRD